MISPGAFIAGRIFIAANYQFPDHSIVISSFKGMEKYLENYMAAGLNEGKTPAYNRFSGHHYSPLIENGVVVGTKVVFVNESDFGGSFPKWILQKFSPSGLNDMYEDLIANVKQSMI